MKGNGIRIAVFFMSAIGVVIMGCWTIPAFWKHIDETGGGHWTLYVGAMAPEIVCGLLVLVHSFFPYIGVRQTALWLGGLLSAITIFHSVAMRGMTESTQRQVAAETRMKDNLTDSSGSLAERLSQPLIAERNRPGTTPARKRQIDQQLTKLQTELGVNAQNNLAKEISGSTQKIYEGQVVSPSYLKNYGFLVLLGSSLAVLITIIYLMMNKEKRDDYDGNFDGIPDRLQGGGYAPARGGSLGFRPPSGPPPSPKGSPLPSAAKVRGGSNR